MGRYRRRRLRARVAVALGATLVIAAMSTSAPATTDAPAAPEGRDGRVSAAAAVRPELPSVVDYALSPASQGTVPDGSAVRARVLGPWNSRSLGAKAKRSLVVRDALTGETLTAFRGETALEPASITKVVTGAAIMAALPPDHTFATATVQGAESDRVVLVAGGDQLLSAGRGNPRAVAGKAGLADLARQTARSLRQEKVSGPVTVALDLSYVGGSRAAPDWTAFWLDNGYAGRISMLALETDRALPGDPAPADPAMAAAESFRASLVEEGVEVADGDIKRGKAPESAAVLGEVTSAPLRDVLTVALATSDNAMVEQLARQAAVADGASPEQDAVNAWVLDTVNQTYDIDTSGATLADTSGLSDGTRLPMRLVADVLVAGASGRHPGLQSVLTGLPIAGYSGTLVDRFGADAAQRARGVVRAKTGSLPQVTSLAGTFTTRDGRLLVFALTAGDIGSGPAELEARAAIDALVSRLVSCGC
ncbi:MAG: D-alanyl-D-alanine carboxypeptidase/D-alanyl-D-alanine-endopeptidase [Ornithinimicrobium sp.]